MIGLWPTEMGGSELYGISKALTQSSIFLSFTDGKLKVGWYNHKLKKKKERNLIS